MEERNWKTTILGILTIIAAVVGIAIKLLSGETPSFAEITVLIGMLTGGAGLVKAKDAK